MRNIQNNSLVRFFYGNLENIIKNPTPETLKIRPGDMLRFLLNKYEIGSENYESLKVCLLPVDKTGATDIFDRTPIIDIGTIRKQLSESFTHFKIKIGNLQKDTYKQFTLVSENPLFTPFSYSGDSMSELMSNFSTHLESNPHTIVRTKSNGSIIDVYMMHSDSFLLASDISVELGEVISYNSNNPSLTTTLNSTYVRPASTDHEMIIIGTVVEGNIFIYNGITYTAGPNTKASDIINYFTNGNLLNIPNTTPVSINFLAGSVIRKNANIPAISSSLSSSGGGNDNYLIRLFGTYQVGNVLTVYTNSRTITHVVAPGDSNSSIEAILNPDSGFFTVTTGTTVNTKGAPGQNEVNNDNNVIFTLNPKNTYPSATVNKYIVSVGSDIVKGNIFKIIDPDNDVEIIVSANSADDNFSIAEKLSGQNNPIFSYERIEQANPIVFSAERGFAYTQEDLMPVTIISQPTIVTPDQVICEISAPTYEELEKGFYILAIRNDDEVVSFSCNVDFSDHADTSLIEAADTNNVFDLNYAEGGLIQRFRTDLMLKSETPSIIESIGTTLEGKEESINTRIEYMAPFTSLPISINLAKSLMILMKNSFVRINGAYVRASEITYTVISEFGKICQMTGVVKLLDEYVDNHNRMSYPRIFASSNAVISAEYSFDLRLLLCNDNFTREIAGETAIPANGYYLETISSKPGMGFLRILVRDQKNVLVEMEVDKQLKHRSIPFRIQPGSKVKIEVTEVAEINNEGFYPVESVEVEVEYVPEEIAPEGGGFDEGFDEGFD